MLKVVSTLKKSYSECGVAMALGGRGKKKALIVLFLIVFYLTIVNLLVVIQ